MMCGLTQKTGQQPDELGSPAAAAALVTHYPSNLGSYQSNSFPLGFLLPRSTERNGPSWGSWIIKLTHYGFPYPMLTATRTV